jgi:hypothetical protein
MGVALPATVTDCPVLVFNDIEETFIEKDSSQSAGASPIFTCTAVVATGVVELDPSPPHPTSPNATIATIHVAIFRPDRRCDRVRYEFRDFMCCSFPLATCTLVWLAQSTLHV